MSQAAKRQTLNDIGPKHLKPIGQVMGFGPKEQSEELLNYPSNFLSDSHSIQSRGGPTLADTRGLRITIRDPNDKLGRQEVYGSESHGRERLTTGRYVDGVSLPIPQRDASPDR